MKCIVRVAMVARKPSFEITVLVRQMRRYNRFEGDGFNEEVRRQQDQTADGRMDAAAGVNCRYRCTVGVADKNAGSYLSRVQHVRQNRVPFVMHVCERTR